MKNLSRLFLKQIAITKPRLISKLASGECVPFNTDKEKINAEAISIFIENFEARTDNLVEFLKGLNFKQLKAIIFKNMSGDSIKSVLEHIKLNKKHLKVLRLESCEMTFDTFNTVLRSLPFKALEIASVSFNSQESMPKLTEQAQVETIYLESFAENYTLPSWLGGFVASMFPSLTQIDLIDFSTEKPMTALNFIQSFTKVNSEPDLYISNQCQQRMRPILFQQSDSTFSDKDMTRFQTEC